MKIFLCRVNFNILLQRRWKEYFEVLLNEEFLGEKQDKVEWNEGLVNKINENEV